MPAGGVFKPPKTALQTAMWAEWIGCGPTSSHTELAQCTDKGIEKAEKEASGQGGRNKWTGIGDITVAQRQKAG